MRRQRYQDVIPFSIAAAAVSESTPSGIGTSWPVGITRRLAVGTQSETVRDPVAGLERRRRRPSDYPTASTTPAASIPIAVGSDGTGYSPLR